MNIESLQNQIDRAKTDPQFFAQLTQDPESILPELKETEKRLESGMISVVPSNPNAKLHKHGAFFACRTTSCGCGGSI
jgi:hypothetical protein